MKKLFALLAIISFLSPKAQITLEQTWNRSSYDGKVTFTNYGEKFYTGSTYYDANNYNGIGSIQIYNYDGSLFKQIVLPVNLYYFPFNLLPAPSLQTEFRRGEPSISDNLFNADGQIEVLAAEDLSNHRVVFHVVDEQGNIAFTFPDTINATNGYAEARIFKYNNAYKLALTAGESTTSKIYALPGSIPCTSCDITSGILEPDNNHGNYKSEMIAYPNPFSKTLSINYQLASKQDAQLILTDVEGRELKSMTLSSQTDKVLLNTTDLPKGLIVISLYDNNQNLISKKLIKLD